MDITAAASASVDQVLGELRTTADGLSGAEASRRLGETGPNAR